MKARRQKPRVWKGSSRDELAGQTRLSASSARAIHGQHRDER